MYNNKITEKNIEVNLSDNLQGSIKKSDLSRDRAEQKTDRFGVGDKVDATVIKIDKNKEKLTYLLKPEKLKKRKKQWKSLAPPIVVQV